MFILNRGLVGLVIHVVVIWTCNCPFLEEDKRI